MNEFEKDFRDLRLAEQAILKESLDAKNERLEELESEVRYLRRLLNDLLAAPRPQLQASPQLAQGGGKDVPRRWRP